jgi:cysteinyl-tRNA synthetase
MRLQDTLSRTNVDVSPVDAGRIAMYSCGPTVYRFAHVGNFRTFLLSDLVRRAFEFEGYEVTQVMNITDVGHMTDESSAEAVDKMLLAAGDEGLSPLEIAAKYERAFHDDGSRIGLLPAHRYPRATEHIEEMVELTAKLIEKGHAYEVQGSVYFDVASFDGYGKLSGNTLDKLRPGHRELETDPNKRSHADFALWKRAGSGRLMKWDSPWGEGFPGWHIECSAMSLRYLGERFDVHTGGVDLTFPHHEDEIAQSESATGSKVVTAWAHGGHLRLSGQKIAKSTGNVIRVPELEEAGFDPLSFRYLTFQTRYRSEMDFSWDAMAAADGKVKQLRHRMAAWAGAERGAVVSSDAARDLDRRFRDAVSSDLDMPAAVVVLNEAVSARIPDADRFLLLSSWDAVLGLDLAREAREGVSVPDDVVELVRQRDEARAARDFAASDLLRDRLSSMGFEVMDTPDGTKVRPKD